MFCMLEGTSTAICCHQHRLLTNSLEYSFILCDITMTVWKKELQQDIRTCSESIMCYFYNVLKVPECIECLRTLQNVYTVWIVLIQSENITKVLECSRVGRFRTLPRFWNFKCSLHILWPRMLSRFCNLKYSQHLQ